MIKILVILVTLVAATIGYPSDVLSFAEMGHRYRYQARMEELEQLLREYTDMTEIQHNRK